MPHAVPVAAPGLAWLAFAAISFIWGSTWLAHKWALETFTPMGLATLRFSLAALICVALGLWRREHWPVRAQWPALLLSGLILTGLANVLTAWSLTHVPSGVGAVLQAPIPVWLALLSLHREPLPFSGWLAVLLGLLGVALVMWPTGRFDVPLWPAVVCVLTAAVWSWASLFQRSRVSTGGLYLRIGIQMGQSAVLGLLLTPWISGYTVPTHAAHAAIPAVAWAALAYLVIFGSVIAFAAYLYLTRVWHPARAGSFAYLNPLVAVLLGAWLAAEPLGWRLLLGMGVILLAVAVLQFAARTRRNVA